MIILFHSKKILPQKMHDEWMQLWNGVEAFVEAFIQFISSRNNIMMGSINAFKIEKLDTIQS